MAISEFYRGKTVLLTGHTGFKGKWLAAWLELLGARVIGFSLPGEEESVPPRARAAASPGVVSLGGDIRDLAAIVKTFQQYQPEVVLHLAAQALVRRSYRQPVETYATNLMGTVHVLEAVRQTSSVLSVVVITTDKCYENREWLWGYRENDRLGGYDPYSSSKACAELATAAYRNSFFGGDGSAVVASARAGNVIGGGDWAEDRLVPDIVRAISSGQPVVIRRPLSRRPWQHVLEPLRGYLMLAERLAGPDGRQFGAGWNFGPDDSHAVTVEQVAKTIVDCWGKGQLDIHSPTDGLHEATWLKLDSSQARQRLVWHPALDLRETVALTVDWYRDFLDGNRPSADLTKRQILAYMERTAS